MNIQKTNLIDSVFSKEKINSFADLGGIWNVDGFYTFYTLAQYKPERAFLVDTNFTAKYNELRANVPNLVSYEGDFKDENIAKLIGEVDAIFLFDVLLHQSDWKALLKLYAERTKYFLVYNPMWEGSEESIRLFDLGKEKYFENVPHTPEHPSYVGLFEDEEKKVSTGVWQWGITVNDLVETMIGLDFKLQYIKNCGQFGDLKNFKNYAFSFSKSESKSVLR